MLKKKFEFQRYPQTITVLNANLSLNVTFVRNDPQATSTAGCAIDNASPVACQLASPLRKKKTPRRGPLYVTSVRMSGKISSVFELVSSYEHI